MTLVYDGADGFKRQGPMPVALKKDDVVHVVIVDGAQQSVAPEGGDDATGWTTAMELIGCLTDKDGATDVARNHDKYLYSRRDSRRPTPGYSGDSSN